MYKAKLWDEDKWDIHSSSYGSSKYTNTNIFSEDKKDSKNYHEQKYGSKEKNASSDYIRKQDEKEEEKDKNSVFDDLEQEKEGKQEIKEDEIPFKAAEQLFRKEKNESNKREQRKGISTIEDAIKKAIEEEKKVVIVDN